MKLSGQDRVISYRDAALQFGQGLFETIRVYAGAPSLLGKHLRRLKTSAAALGFPPLPASHKIAGMVCGYVADHRLENAAVRLTITAGNTAEAIDPAIIITHRDINLPDRIYTEGATAIIAANRRNPASPSVRHKSIQQVDNLLEVQRARAAGAFESIWLNSRGFLAECTWSNLFFVKDNVVFTPDDDCGLLPGIARGLVIKLLKENEVECRQGKFLQEELFLADECFCSNVVREVVPLISVDGRVIGNGKPGPLTGRIHDWYRRLAQKACRIRNS